MTYRHVIRAGRSNQDLSGFAKTFLHRNLLDVVCFLEPNNAIRISVSLSILIIYSKPAKVENPRFIKSYQTPKKLKAIHHDCFPLLNVIAKIL